MATADVLYIKAAAGAVHKNTHGSKVYRHTVDRYRHGQCNAEIDDDGSDPGIWIERFIGVTEFMTAPAVKPFDRDVYGSLSVIGGQVRELFSFRIITGKEATAYGAYGVSGKGNPVSCRDPALDDIGNNREYMGRFHAMRASRDPAILG